jgi:murein L,D-transpeptidase YafK
MRDLRTLLSSKALRLAGAAVVAGLLAGCQADELGYGPKHLRSVGRETAGIMEKLGMSETSPVLMRIFKEESKFEVWKQDRTGRYQLLKSYDICKWSGKLGPKIKEGDRQAPEGYYTITPGLMNPNSQYFLAFNTGFPNAYDRANGRTGTALMVHGACSSRGCYAMTDEQIQEIYALARDAFRGGQRAFQLQAYPFRMTPENMARHWNDPNMPFWKMLKEGYDTFELTRQEPKVDVCGRKYVFNSTPKSGSMMPAAACPELMQPESLKVALAAKAKADEEKAIVIAARLDGERKAEEQQQILVAQRHEEEKQRIAEREIAARERGTALASLFGAAGSAETPAPASTPVPTVAVAAADGAPVAVASGEPLPKSNPRAPATGALAMTETAPAAGNGSMFTRLFSFGDEEPVPAPAPAGVASVQPAAPSAPEAAAAPAPAPTQVASAETGQPTTMIRGLAPACAPAGAVAAPGTPVCPPSLTAAPPAPPPAEEPGLMDKLTGWF